MKKPDAAVEIAAQRLIELYKPSAQTCRPYVLQNGVPNEQSLTTIEEGILACMIAGYKEVGFATFSDPLLKQIAQYYDIQTVDDVSFAPRGADKAQLIIRAKEQRNDQLLDGHNHYFYGYVLGYSDNDILGFYQWLFVQDKRDAHAWIAHAHNSGQRDTAVLLEMAQKGELTFMIDDTVHTRHEIPYLVALLAGVPEKDIRALYDQNARQRFERDKKKALAWISNVGASIKN